MPAKSKPTQKVTQGKIKIRKNPRRRMALFGTVGMLLVLGAVWLFASHAATGTRVAIVADATGKGYWEAAADGGVFAIGDAPFYGSKGATSLAAPIVGMVATADAKGYFLVGQDGGVFAFGDATFHGSLPGSYPSAGIKNIVGMALDPATGGYWLVGSDGGVFSFDAPFHGSMGGKILAKPVVGIASTADGGGYWLVGADGGVFNFGDAPFLGSLAGKVLNAPVSGIARQAGTNNFWLTAQDGGVFTFGSPFYGSLSGKTLTGAVLGMASSPDGKGYWLVGADGGVFSFGDAVFAGTAPQVNPATVTVSTQPKPVCVSMDINSNGQTVTISGVGLSANGNVYKNTVINWGDGSAAATVANAAGQAHVFGYGNFTISVTPHFTWNNQDYAASSSACSRPVTSSKPITVVPNTGSHPSAPVGNSLPAGYGDGCGGNAKLTADGGGCTCNNGITIYYDGPMPNSTTNPGCSNPAEAGGTRPATLPSSPAPVSQTIGYVTPTGQATQGQPDIVTLINLLPPPPPPTSNCAAGLISADVGLGWECLSHSAAAQIYSSGIYTTQGWWGPTTHYPNLECHLSPQAAQDAGTTIGKINAQGYCVPG